VTGVRDIERERRGLDPEVDRRPVRATPRVSSRLDINDVIINYTQRERQVRAVDGVSMSTDSGEFVAIVGPSGCGKTSLMMAVDGLVPIDSGSIELNGRRITKPGRERAVVFQDPSLLPWRSVLGNVTFAVESGRRPRGERLTRGEAERRARELLDLVGLSEFPSSYPSHLSGGMRQRVNLARALAVNPELLLLDEPFAALDAQTREKMQEELLRILGADRATALLITHQVDEAVYLSDRVIVFSSRPARVVAEFDVLIPRPRRPEHRDLPAFDKLVHEIRTIVRQEYDRATAAAKGGIL
jgi:NitT/TauT family transport system ATP-binding protein